MDCARTEYDGHYVTRIFVCRKVPESDEDYNKRLAAWEETLATIETKAKTENIQ